MAQGPLYLYDMGLRLYHPPVLMENRKYIQLVEKLCDIYPSQRRESDSFEFMLSQAQSVRVTPQVTSVGELFEGDPKPTLKRVLHVLGKILNVMDIERIETFDHVVSARFRPPGDKSAARYDDYPADLYIEKTFLRPMDFSHLKTEAQRPSPAVNWVYDLGPKGVSLRVEPLADDRDVLLVELTVQHPQANISLGDIHAEIAADVKYLKENVVPFLLGARGA